MSKNSKFHLDGNDVKENYTRTFADGTNTTFDGSNPDIRFGEGGLVGDIYTVEEFSVIIGDDTYSDSVYKGNDYDKAILEYNRVTPNDFLSPTSSYNTKSLQKRTVQYKFIGQIEDYEEISDYTDYLDDTTY